MPRPLPRLLTVARGIGTFITSGTLSAVGEAAGGLVGVEPTGAGWCSGGRGVGLGGAAWGVPPIRARGGARDQAALGRAHSCGCLFASPDGFRMAQRGTSRHRSDDVSGVRFGRDTRLAGLRYDCGGRLGASPRTVFFRVGHVCWSLAVPDWSASNGPADPAGALCSSGLQPVCLRGAALRAGAPCGPCRRIE